MSKSVFIVALCLAGGLLAGCGASEDTPDTDASTQTAPVQNPTAETTPVVDYLGKPPPMTSPTQILSGGWLIRGDGSEPMFDTLVVITSGKIVGVGKRGSLDVPNDSVGIDASGKWILPGPLATLTQALNNRDHDNPLHFIDKNFHAINQDRSADLVLFNSNPLRAPEALADVHAEVINGAIIDSGAKN